ncbi:MAG: ATP synthase F0 subunit B [Proteobacteria bacterium]|nr:MAG: ATP synthase F0 subunit B [Pseudomonadota bacterium]
MPYPKPEARFMQIDWLTVIAQIVNFLILVWLLKRFLYQPVINAMDCREKRIADQLHQAEAREQAAVDVTQEYQGKIEAWEREHGELVEQAKSAAESERLELLDAARSEVNERRARWQHQLDQEKRDFLHTLRRHIADSVQTVARRALTDLSDTELEGRIIQLFIRRLESLDTETRAAIVASNDPIHLSTSFVLHSPLRDRLTRAIHEHIGEKIELIYSESPQILCGVELTASGRRLSWSLDDYLEGLEQAIKQELEMGNAAAG